MPDILASITLSGSFGFRFTQNASAGNSLNTQYAELVLDALGSSVRGGEQDSRGSCGSSVTDRTGFTALHFDSLGLQVLCLTDLIATLLKSTPPGRE